MKQTKTLCDKCGQEIINDLYFEIQITKCLNEMPIDGSEEIKELCKTCYEKFKILSWEIIGENEDA